MIINTKTTADYARTMAREAWTFVKENPGELLLACITAASFDIAESLDGIEEMDGFLFIDQEPGA
tara:strand:+ start:434 stop:628 length:195 start_codon:yes stop_codon:yes gene_type:complete